MRNTTLCYIEQDGKFLMMHRTKKKNDASHNKWIGVGGKCEENESPTDCIIRETREETGLLLIKPNLRGIVSFFSDKWESEYMFIYTAKDFEGNLSEDCAEGELAWVEKKDIMNLSLWEGDKIFLKLLLDEADFFQLKLVYRGEELIESSLQ